MDSWHGFCLCSSKMKLRNTLFLSILGFSNATAATLLTENFDYSDGSLGTLNTAWQNHSGTAGDLLVTSGAAIVQHGTPSEDINVQFDAVSAGTLTATFDLTVNDDTPIGGSDFEYFAHFMTRGSSNFRARLDIQASASGDYTLGISSSTSTAEATLTAGFTYGTVVPVIMSFDVETGTASLTVEGETITGSANGAESIDAFALRQSDSSNNETVTIDNLVISDSSVVPEPSSALLGGLALLGLVRRKR